MLLVLALLCLSLAEEYTSREKAIISQLHLDEKLDIRGYVKDSKIYVDIYNGEELQFSCTGDINVIKCDEGIYYIKN